MWHQTPFCSASIFWTRLFYEGQASTDQVPQLPFLWRGSARIAFFTVSLFFFQPVPQTGGISLKTSVIRRGDNRLYFARQASSAQGLFMRLASTDQVPLKLLSCFYWRKLLFNFLFFCRGPYHRTLHLPSPLRSLLLRNSLCFPDLSTPHHSFPSPPQKMSSLFCLICQRKTGKSHITLTFPS